MSVSTVKPRVNFASVKNPLPYPDFLDIQLKSFHDFLQLDTPLEKRKNEGLYKVFAENFPIADTRNNFVLEFLDYYIDPPRYTIEECLERGLTYSVPLKAKLKLYCTDPDHEDFDTVIQDVYLGPIPYMTEKGTFVINGAERVVVSQLHRSPGVFFGQSTHANGTKLYSARIIPFRGSWIEFATDINNVMYAYIDRKKKLPVTTLLRAIGLDSDKDIIEIFGLAEEIKVTKSNLKKAVGRKLAARVLKTWVEDFVDEDTGEVVSIERNDVIIDRETVLEEVKALRAELRTVSENAAASFIECCPPVFVSPFELSAFQKCAGRKQFFALREKDGVIVWLLSGSQELFNEFRTHFSALRISGGGRAPLFQGRAQCSRTELMSVVSDMFEKEESNE